jgi:hypothetical protein
LICKDGLAHPRADEQTDRTLANVTDDFAYLRSLYPFHKVEVVSFEAIPFGQKLAQMAKVDMFVAVHGAGNIYVLSLPIMRFL